MLDAGILEAPDWSSLSVEGPEQFADEHGRKWFGYWASLTTQVLADSGL